MKEKNVVLEWTGVSEIAEVVGNEFIVVDHKEVRL